MLDAPDPLTQKAQKKNHQHANQFAYIAWRGKMAAAYVIGIRESMTDAAEMKAYSKKAGPTLADATMLALYGRHEVLEGDPADGIVILKFDSYDAAKQWYDSEDYKQAIPHRLAGADYRIILVEGV